jgi:hypothetical protein
VQRRQKKSDVNRFRQEVRGVADIVRNNRFIQLIITGVPLIFPEMIFGGLKLSLQFDGH